MTDTDRRFEALEAELKDVGTHISETDRRIRALETAMGRLAGGADIVHEAQPGPVAKAISDGAQLNDDEWRTKVSDMQRELEGARKVAENQRRIANERTDERDALRDELERLKLDLEERAESPCEERASGTAAETPEEDAP